jgi:hypothetical protein
MFMSGEAGDVAADYITARLTTKPNVIAVTKPFLKSSFRADMSSGDSKENQLKKYSMASRNYKVSFKFACLLFCHNHFSPSYIAFFKQIRDPASNKYGKDFWCEPAWDEHQATLQHVANFQKSEGKAYQVMLAVYLLVFPLGVKFSFKYCPQFLKRDGTILGDKTNVFTNNKQVVTNIRWILPTHRATLVREDVNEENDDLTQRLLFSRMNLAEDDDFDKEGMVT